MTPIQPADMCDYKLLLSKHEDTYLDIVPHDILKLIANYLSTDRVRSATRKSPEFNAPKALGYSVCIVQALSDDRLIMERRAVEPEPDEEELERRADALARSIMRSAGDPDNDDDDKPKLPIDYAIVDRDWRPMPYDELDICAESDPVWTSSRVIYKAKGDRSKFYLPKHTEFVIADHTGEEISRIPLLWKVLSFGAAGCDLERATSVRIIDERHASCSIGGTVSIFDYVNRYFLDQQVTAKNRAGPADFSAAICGKYTVFLREHRVFSLADHSQLIVFSIIVFDGTTEIYGKEIVKIANDSHHENVYHQYAPQLYVVHGEQAVVVVMRIPDGERYHFRITKYRIYDRCDAPFVSRRMSENIILPPIQEVEDEPEDEPEDESDDKPKNSFGAMFRDFVPY